MSAINADAFTNAGKAHWKVFESLPEYMLVIRAGSMVGHRKSGKKFPMGEKDQDHLPEN